ncbi:c-type cytochrome [Acidicapsa ligni]|uniref:c-type cytochrome n=1 Tax=Acidicapsa ligni TaxID=542300 RepID=UPI0021E0DAD2|nr:c-type cytochrome [Acidicapsa ligni]
MTLYKHNCAGCHGDQGRGGVAISLANPIYLATAGIDNIRRITTQGVPGTMMPAFGKEQGGLLTEEQISILSKGMLDAWAHPDVLHGLLPLAYAKAQEGDAARGQLAFAVSCARCHGADGKGTDAGASLHGASIVDPSYLALISDQGLRSIIISGQPERGMPDWRTDIQGSPLRTMTGEEISDIVAWLAAHRTQTPGQPYAEVK